MDGQTDGKRSVEGAGREHPAAAAAAGADCAARLPAEHPRSDVLTLCPRFCCGLEREAGHYKERSKQASHISPPPPPPPIEFGLFGYERQTGRLQFA